MSACSVGRFNMKSLTFSAFFRDGYSKGPVYIFVVLWLQLLHCGFCLHVVAYFLLYLCFLVFLFVLSTFAQQLEVLKHMSPVKCMRQCLLRNSVDNLTYLMHGEMGATTWSCLQRCITSNKHAKMRLETQTFNNDMMLSYENDVSVFIFKVIL